jgi:hypothetical protein
MAYTPLLAFGSKGSFERFEKDVKPADGGQRLIVLEAHFEQQHL